MSNGFTAVMELLNRTMPVTIKTGLAFGIMARTDRRGTVYHTIDGRRHETMTDAINHARGRRDKLREKAKQVKSKKPNRRQALSF